MQAWSAVRPIECPGLRADARVIKADGIQRPPPATRTLFETLKAEGLTYIDSVIDFGTGAGTVTQHTRLPRESLRHGSNCIDGDGADGQLA